MVVSFTKIKKDKFKHTILSSWQKFLIECENMGQP